MVVGVLVIKGMDFNVAAGGICGRGVMFPGGPLASMLLGGSVCGFDDDEGRETAAWERPSCCTADTSCCC